MLSWLLGCDGRPRGWLALYFGKNVKLKNVSSDRATLVLVIATIASVLVALLLLRGAGLFYYGGRFLGLKELEELGAFLSGLFTPLAIGWAARGFLLQRQQMVEAFEGMERQIDLQRRALDQQRDQIKFDQERVANDRIEFLKNGDPVLQMTGGSHSSGSSGSSATFYIRNHGATAQRIFVCYKIFDAATNSIISEKSALVPGSLATGGDKDIVVNLPNGVVNANNYCLEFEVKAERLDAAVSRWRFRCSRSFSPELVDHDVAVPGLNI